MLRETTPIAGLTGMPAGIIDLPSLLRVRELVRAAQPEYVLPDRLNTLPFLPTGSAREAVQEFEEDRQNNAPLHRMDSVSGSESTRTGDGTSGGSPSWRFQGGGGTAFAFGGAVLLWRFKMQL